MLHCHRKLQKNQSLLVLTINRLISFFKNLIVLNYTVLLRYSAEVKYTSSNNHCLCIIVLLVSSESYHT